MVDKRYAAYTPEQHELHKGPVRSNSLLKLKLLYGSQFITLTLYQDDHF